MSLDVTDAAALGHLIAAHDIVISLLPYTMHLPVAEACIEQGRDLVTTSYQTPAMEALEDRARAAGVTILNEVGLDPGLDHLEALRVVRDVHAKGGAWAWPLATDGAHTRTIHTYMHTSIHTHTFLHTPFTSIHTHSFIIPAALVTVIVATAFYCNLWCGIAPSRHPLLCQLSMSRGVQSPYPPLLLHRRWMPWHAYIV